VPLNVCYKYSINSSFKLSLIHKVNWFGFILHTFIFTGFAFIYSLSGTPQKLAFSPCVCECVARVIGTEMSRVVNFIYNWNWKYREHKVRIESQSLYDYIYIKVYVVSAAL